MSQTIELPLRPAHPKTANFPVKPIKVNPEMMVAFYGGGRNTNMYTTGMSPSIPAHFTAAIKAAEPMLSLPNNWDDEGAVAISRDTWTRAINLIRNTAIDYLSLTHILIEAPRISACHDGSIDILWRSGEREVLINLPVDSHELASYYGDTNRERGEIIKGAFKQNSQPLWILLWLNS